MIAVLSTASALSFPIAARAPRTGLVAIWLLLLALHVALYWYGHVVRERFGPRAYAAAQGVTLFAIALVNVIPPVVLGLFVAFTAELVLLVGRAWGSVRITAGVIALFVAAALITADMYRAATAGLILALAGLVAHAIAGLLRDRVFVIAAPEPTDASAHTSNGSTNGTVPTAMHGLSVRELEVLRELAAGARNSEIAATLRISERTVKAHLGHIYQKLGVSTRAGAVAVAAQRRLV